uniref:Peptidase S1 domain-containing protein n=1 Tax=Strix occidentalis caurina TaxID=311401 RepID=A0A8D0FIK1_STROC
MLTMAPRMWWRAQTPCQGSGPGSSASRIPGQQARGMCVPHPHHHVLLPSPFLAVRPVPGHCRARLRGCSGEGWAPATASYSLQLDTPGAQGMQGQSQPLQRCFPLPRVKQRAGNCWAAAARGSVPSEPSPHLPSRHITMWRVVVGATRLTQPGPEAQMRNIKRLLVHPRYSNITKRNDIALLELDQPVQYGYYVQLACVPDASLRVSELTTCYVSGWGAMTARCEFPKSAHTAGDLATSCRVHLIDLNLCNSSRWYRGAVHPHNLCAGSPQGGIDTCQGGGDSSGPLVCKDNSADYFWFVGVTSCGRGCARAKRTRIYTSTQHFYNWILVQMGLCSAARAAPTSWAWSPFLTASTPLSEAKPNTSTVRQV